MQDFFIQQLILQNDRARLEPLSKDHYPLLWAVAKHKKPWQFTSAKVKAE